MATAFLPAVSAAWVRCWRSRCCDSTCSPGWPLADICLAWWWSFEEASCRCRAEWQREVVPVWLKLSLYSAGCRSTWRKQVWRERRKPTQKLQTHWPRGSVTKEKALPLSLSRPPCQACHGLGSEPEIVEKCSINALWHSFKCSQFLHLWNFRVWNCEQRTSIKM